MTSDLTPQVRILREDEKILLPDSVWCAAGFVGLDPWLSFVQKMYGFPVYRVVAEAENRIEGWLALVRVKHLIFGDYLTTSPFGSYGGLAYSSLSARDALLEKARALASELGVDYVNIRFDTGDEIPPEGWTQHSAYATYLVDLLPDPHQLMTAYSSDHRNHIRKSFKRRFSIKFGHLDLLDDTYEALARSMHELGSPYHNKAYLRTMAESLGEDLELVVLYGPRDEPAGAAVFILHGSTGINLHANILRRFRSDYAGEFLYWMALERYCRRGLKIFDLGRSLIGSGNETFKMKWRPRKKLLAYWYALSPGQPVPALNQKNPKFQLAIQVWKRLPAFVVRPLGPFLIKGLA
jgi:FemAB-related protein (PEP-CTERM system-associated)